MNKLEKSKEINVMNQLYKSMNVSNNVIKTLRSLVDELLEDVTRHNEYVYTDKEILHRYNSGKVDYASNSKDIRFKEIYLSGESRYDALIGRITWNCNQIRRDVSTEFEVVFTVYTPDGGSKKFRKVFDMTKLVQEKKKFFMKQTYINYNDIGTEMIDFYSDMKKLLKEALDTAMKKHM